MGFKCFRMSISWPRLFPTGEEATPNPEGIRFYHDVFDELHKYGIEPVVTMIHYEIPLHLTLAYNGWESRKTLEAYCPGVQRMGVAQDAGGVLSLCARAP